MIPDPQLAARIAEWNQRAIAGTLTREEMKEAIILMRQGRVSAAVASEKSKASKSKAPPPDADDMLAELMG